MNDDGVAGCVGCLFQLVLTAIYVVIAAWSVNFLLVLAGRPEIPFLGAAVVGFIGGAVTVPVAICLLILRHFGAI